MKYLLTLVAGLGVYIAMVGCQAPADDGSTAKSAETSVEATIQPVSFNVTGMT